ncbi:MULTISPECIES: hypothetical protein [unclassified Mesorhizobium]|uniref:hypothetical protein n=1 Tax=unclassified Mesorhizobium TaxID=325217 RepID=UPI003335E3E4
MAAVARNSTGREAHRVTERQFPLLIGKMTAITELRIADALSLAKELSRERDQRVFFESWLQENVDTLPYEEEVNSPWQPG